MAENTKLKVWDVYTFLFHKSKDIFSQDYRIEKGIYMGRTPIGTRKKDDSGWRDVFLTRTGLYCCSSFSERDKGFLPISLEVVNPSTLAKDSSRKEYLEHLLTKKGL